MLRKLFSILFILFAAAPALSVYAQCNVPSSVTAATKSTSAIISWAPAKNGFAYEYYVAPSPSTPPVNGTINAGATFAVISDLLPNTLYDACVRTVCSPVSSPWVCTSFKTAAASSCADPSVIAYGKTHSKGFAEWAKISGAMGYEYSINPGLSTAAGPATTTSNNLLSLGSLSSSGTYNICVRTKCSNTLYSEWACDTLNTVEELDVAATAQQQPQILCFPNPVNEVLHIETAGNTPGATLMLTNIYGVVVYRAQVTGKSDISMRDYTPGIYILRYHNGTDNYSLKVQKQ